MSVHDLEMRHGRKSKAKRFDGHKTPVAVDTDSQLITAVSVLPGNSSDNVGALKLVEESEENAGIEVEEAIGDAVHGDGTARKAFADGQWHFLLVQPLTCILTVSCWTCEPPKRLDC